MALFTLVSLNVIGNPLITLLTHRIYHVNVASLCRCDRSDQRLMLSLASTTPIHLTDASEYWRHRISSISTDVELKIEVARSLIRRRTLSKRRRDFVRVDKFELDI